jgi:hypothetical protein
MIASFRLFTTCKMAGLKNALASSRETAGDKIRSPAPPAPEGSCAAFDAVARPEGLRGQTTKNDGLPHWPAAKMHFLLAEDVGQRMVLCRLPPSP